MMRGCTTPAGRRLFVERRRESPPVASRTESGDQVGKRVWRVVVAGGAAAVFTAVAAEGGVSFTRVQVNGGKPIVIGVSNEVEVPASFRMA
ncbi:hypothetical protein ACWCO7_15055, partial [Streptomyces violaceorubidus]